MRVKKSLTNLILLTLEKSIEGYAHFEDFAYNAHAYAYSNYPRDIKTPSLAKALKRLREQGLIEFTSDEQLKVRLTDSGRDRALWEKMKEEESKWDGKWRLVIFDIPEKRRIARDALRSKIKMLGFKLWQKSVWASKKNCTQVLRDFIKKVGIEKWVMVIESENVGDIDV